MGYSPAKSKNTIQMVSITQLVESNSVIRREGGIQPSSVELFLFLAFQCSSARHCTLFHPHAN